jgi:hypothetical protein
MVYDLDPLEHLSKFMYRFVVDRRATTDGATGDTQLVDKAG